MKLSDFDHFKDNKYVRFRHETVGGKQFTIVVYMIADLDFWKIPFATETRGHVFDEHGVCVSRTFEKFFNLNENQMVQHKDLNFKNAKFFDKLDGSMITPIVIDDEVYLKTKKSFYSEVALEANSNFPEHYKQFVKDCMYTGKTPIFEYYSPKYKVVLDYGKMPIFTLLAIRDNITGEYVDYDALSYLAKLYNIEYVVLHDTKTIEAALTDAETSVGIEGYVCQLENNTRVKVKTEWYRINHHIQTDLNYRNIAELACDEKLDDIKAKLTEEKVDLEIINQIETQVCDEISEIINTTEEEFERIKTIYNIDAVYNTENSTDEYRAKLKLIVNEIQKFKYFGFVMVMLRGGEPKYKQYWKDNYLKNYSTKAIYNKNF